MPLSPCPHCGKQVRLQDRHCWNCGRVVHAEVPEKKPAPSNPWGIVISLGLMGLIAVMCFSGPDQATEASAPSVAAPVTHEVVENSAWDGSVRQVKEYLKTEMLKDPDSYESIEWSKVAHTADGGFMVRHKFRAKNSFGGYEVETYGFMLDSTGTVIGAVKMD